MQTCAKQARRKLGLQTQRSFDVGVNSFRILKPSTAYGCVIESWGAVVNNCTYDVDFVFDLPVDTQGSKTVSGEDYIGGTGSFGCYAISFGTDGKSDNNSSSTQTFNASGQELLNFPVKVDADGRCRFIAGMWDAAGFPKQLSMKGSRSAHCP
jgi:hypothetical protein